jgi:L,D-transpeptidase YcbB
MRELRNRFTLECSKVLRGVTVVVAASLISVPAHAKDPSILDRIMSTILPAPAQAPKAKPAQKPVQRPAASKPVASAQKPRPAAPSPARPTPGTTIAIMSGELRSKLEADTTLTALDKKVLLKFYSDRSFAPVWFEPHPSPSKTDAVLRLNAKALGLRKSMPELNNHGLKAAKYWSAELENVKLAPATDWVKNELALSRALTRSSIDLNIGRIDPAKVNSDIKLTRKPFGAWQVLQNSVSGAEFVSPWDTLAPQIPAYARLRDSMRWLRALNSEGGFGKLVPAKSILKLGSSAEIVLELKTRAKAMGYEISNVDTEFDSELEAAVKDIQKSNLTKATGVLKPTDLATWEFFTASSQDRINEIAITMEKLRWLPHQLEARHLFINLATQRMNVVDPNLSMPSLKEQKVIVGKATPQTRTPTFRNTMTYVVMNPTWSVPSSIFFRSKIGMIRKLLEEQGQYAVDDWFYRNGFSIIYSQGGQKYPVQPGQVDWYAPNDSFVNAVTLKQMPRYDNALGVVKFMLSNDYSIWLHDTNERHLFASDARALSSGCIRLERPKDLAEYLLAPKGFDRERLESTFVTPGQMDARESWVNMTNEKLPVYTMALTANAGTDGILRFTRDLYKQNADVAQALKLAGF